MCNFNKLDEETKALIHQFMTDAANSVGGVNHLLGLIEAMKAKKTNALMFAGKQVTSDHSSIKWNKIVFKDKIDVLTAILTDHRNAENPDLNILAGKSDKKKKLIINMVKTLAPLEFVVTPQSSNDGEGFNFKVFDSIEDDCVKLNPIFVAMFFCSIEFMKKALK
jgi:hypothetical protein